MADILERQGAKGTSYQARVRRVGFPTVFKTFKTKKEADAWATTQENKLLERQPLLTKEKERFTFGLAIDEYAEHSGYLSKSEEYLMKQIREDFEDLAIVNLTAPRLAKYIKDWKQRDVPSPRSKKRDHPLFNGNVPRKHSDSTVRKVYFAIKKIVEWHSGFRNYPVQNIFRVVQAPSNQVERSRRLSPDEEKRILEACQRMYTNQNELKTAFLVSLETGMRAGEMLKVEWHEVDFNHRSIKIPKEKTKTKRYREVPMTTVCVKLIQDHLATKNPEDPRVFWQWKSSHALSQRFRVVLKNAGVKDYRWHDNRHEATSRFFERTTLRDIEIAQITGHSSMSTLRRYANLRTNNLAEKLW